MPPRLPPSKQISFQPLSPSKFGQCCSDQFCRRFPTPASVQGRAHSAFGVDAGVAERHQCAHGVVGGGSGWCRAGAARFSQSVEIVGEIENQTLGFLPSHARNALQSGDVLLADGADQSRRRQRGQQTYRQRRSDSVRRQQLLEQPLLENRREAKELPRIFLDHQRRVERDVFIYARQRLVDVEWNRELVADAAMGHHFYRIEILGDELPLDACDHVIARKRSGSIFGRSGIRANASAAATPSAASLGCGADLSRSRRITMNWICSLVAAPVPATAFLISDGGYS